jgi:murein DD-endopeptidase MepM/ murein hydrolase activator NlpD
MEPIFQHPIEPYIVNQAWGVYDPADYSQFGFTRHNGVDLRLAADKLIRAPFDGTVVRVATKENGLWQPNGGGVFDGIVSDPYDFPAFTNTTPDGVAVEFTAGKYSVLCDLLHLESISVKEGDRVKAGDVVAVGDNTGFSTGPHCHTQWRRVEWYGGTNYLLVDNNEANDSFDPTQFFGEAAPGELSPADKVAVLAAQDQAKGDTKNASILYAIARFIRSMLSG